VELCVSVLRDPMGGSSKGCRPFVRLEELVWEDFFCSMEFSPLVFNVDHLEGTEHVFFRIRRRVEVSFLRPSWVYHFIV
jgi:hypothetical protein